MTGPAPVLAACVAHRRVVQLRADGVWCHPDGLVCNAADPAIGARRCANCTRPLWEHCTRHLLPCCPGRCTPPSALERALGAT